MERRSFRREPATPWQQKNREPPSGGFMLSGQLDRAGVFTVKFLRQCNGPMRSRAAAMQKETTPSCGGAIDGATRIQSDSPSALPMTSPLLPPRQTTSSPQHLDCLIFVLPVAAMGSPASIWVWTEFAPGNLDHPCRVGYENVRRQPAVQ